MKVTIMSRVVSIIVLTMIAATTQAMECEEQSTPLQERLVKGDPDYAAHNTEAINCEISQVALEGGGVVSLPEGVIYVRRLILKSHIHLKMTPMTTLVAGFIARDYYVSSSDGETTMRCTFTPHDLTRDATTIHTFIIDLWQYSPGRSSQEPITNVQITGGRLVGPNATTSYCGLNGIKIQGNVSDVTIDGTKLTRFISGIHISHDGSHRELPSYITINNVQSNGNRHLGLAVTGGHDIAVTDSQFNTNGLAGIDVENHSARPIGNLLFYRIEASHNSTGAPNLGGAGIVIQRGLCSEAGCPGDTTISGVEITSSRFIGNTGVGIGISGTRLYESDNAPFHGISISDVLVTDNGHLFVLKETETDRPGTPIQRRSSGITISNTEGLAIRDSIVKRNGGAGVSAVNVGNATIEDNTVWHNGDDGIRVRSLNNDQASIHCLEHSACTIQRNNLQDNTNGILASAGTVTVVDNDVSSSKQSGINVVRSTNDVDVNIQVLSNRVSGTGGTAVAVNAVGGKAEVTGNELWNAGFDGFAGLSMGSDSSVAGNSIARSKRFGIILLSPSEEFSEQVVAEANNVSLSETKDVVIAR